MSAVLMARRGVILLLVCRAAAVAPAVAGQRPPGAPTGETPLAPLATIAVWADDVWLSILDRDGAYFGRLAEEGILQRFNRRMDHEYDLDVATGLFTPAEDARWAPAERGLRLAGASISHPHILNDIDLRQSVPIAGTVDLPFRYRRQHSLTARRDYPQLGVRWRQMFGSDWDGRVAVGVHFFKPSADFEVGMAREWRTAGGGGVRADLRVAVLDAFNDAIFGGLGVEPELVDAHLDYSAAPLATRLALQWRTPRLRFETEGGVTNRNRVSVTFPTTGAPGYSQAERVAFLGVLAETTVSKAVGLAAYGTWSRADTNRDFFESRDQDFELSEVTWSLGARGGLRLSPSLAVEAGAGAAGRPEDRDRGDGTSVRHRDHARFGRVAVIRRPPAGWLWRAAVLIADRDAGEIQPELSGTNSRLVLESGYRWPSSLHFLAGVRWDLDSVGSAPFDGGHVRLEATW